eukprot:TRINITY_DN6406_c0_g2_i1.p1 TRINITY_DN6406_c0_g2~~TRINITY_DN6406_c0_g2_i1.p1  ORF type:complete len:3422 (+),score=1031.07 TRINITY_DN6406_c0_g2_i1:132-10268(+)
MNEATAVVEKQIEADVERAVEDVVVAQKEEEKEKEEEKKEDEKDKDEEAAEEEEEEKEPSETPSEAREKRREAEAKLKKAQKRLNKLESLRYAKSVGALTQDSYNAAVRRLHSSTGNDPTDGKALHTLPEGLEWFTTLLEVMWPGFRNHARNTVLETVQPALNRACAGYGVTCTITHFDLGANSPAFGPITSRYVAHDGADAKQKAGLEISIGITIRSDMKLEMSTSAGSVGIQNFSFTGTLYMWFRPFLDAPPFIGAIEMAFVNPPVLELDWTGFVGGALECMGLQKVVRDTIDYYLAEYCVVPNFYVYPMVANHPKIDMARLRCPKPEGVVRLTISGVKNPPTNLLSPSRELRVNIKIGSQKWATPAAANPAIPRWSSEVATRDFIVYNQDQWVILELLDGTGDDNVLGSVLNVPVNRLVKRHKVSVPIAKCQFPVTNSMAEPTMISVTATWVSIDPNNPTTGDCLASVQLTEAINVPASLSSKAPFKLVATMKEGDVTRSTKAGTAKPGATSDPLEMLKLLRSHKGKTPITIAKIHGLTDHELVKEAIAVDKATNKYTLCKTEEGTEQWMGLPFLLDWQAYPENKKAKWATEGLPKGEDITNKEHSRRVAYFKSYDNLHRWCNKMVNNESGNLAATNPYYCQVLHLPCVEASEITLSLVDKNGKAVAETAIKVEDTSMGDEPDAFGPWKLEYCAEGEEGLTGEKKIEVSGDITVRNLKIAEELPANWNLQADTLVAKNEFVEWWMHEMYVMDWAEWKESVESSDSPVSGFIPIKTKGLMWMASNWPGGDKTFASEEELRRRDEYYTNGKDLVEGSGVNDDKEEALLQCLKAGALTWGDYDTILSQLRGEPDPPSLAETLEWLNMFVSALWPGVTKYTAKVIKESVEPSVQSAVSQYAPGVTVTLSKVNLGKREPAFGTIQCRKLADGCELAFCGFAFESAIDIQAAITFGKTVTVGVKDVMFKGDFLVSLRPLLSGMPLVGAIQVVMPNPPDVDMKMTGNVGSIFETLKDQIPAFDTMVKSTVRSSIASCIAIPNYYVYPMVEGVDTAVLQNPKPLGVLRIDVKEALHLRAGDTDNSDSYVVVKVGDVVKQTKYVTSLNPKWSAEQHGSVMDFVVYSLDQIVDLEVFDYDMIGADDSLGALYQKTTVLGGGIDEIRRGIPVRALKSLGTAALPLQEKVKDTVCTSPKAAHAVYELRNVIGYDQSESVIVLHASWMEQGDQGVDKSYVASVVVREGKNLNASLKPPFTVRVTAGGVSKTTRQGAAPPDKIANPPELVKTIQQLIESGHTAEKTAKVLSLTVKLVEAASSLAPGSLDEAEQQKIKSWHAECIEARRLSRRGTNPHFNQAIHLPFPSTRETELKASSYVCPVTVELLNASSKPVGTATIDLSIGNPVDKLVLLEAEGAPGAGIVCTASLMGFKGKVIGQKDLSEDEDILGFTPFEGPEFIDTPLGVQPKIGMYVSCRNLVKKTELNWRITNKKPGELVKRGDRPQPEGKVVGWTQDNDRAVVDFGPKYGEWRVKPVNLLNAPPPLPPPPPPQKLYVVADEVMEVEGEFDVAAKRCRQEPYWEREAYGLGEVWRIFTMEDGRWGVGPAHMEGVAYVRSVQPHHGRFPHMMGHPLDPAFTSLTEEQQAALTPPRILWQRMDIDLDAPTNETVWVDDSTVEVTITKPIAREHEEVLEEMHDQIIEDIMDDLEADLLEDIEADLQADLEADLQADLEQDLAADIEGGLEDELEIEAYDEDQAAAEEAQAEAEAEAARLAEEEEERMRAEEEERQRAAEEEAARQAEEEERRRQEEEEERRRQEEEERKRQEEEEAEKRRQQEEEDRKKSDEERRQAEEERRQAEEERRRKEEEAKKAEDERKRQEAEKKKKEEEEKRRKEAEEKKKREEEEKKRKEEEEKKKKEEERKRKEEEERKKKEEEARKKKEEEERKRREEEERRRREEMRKKQAEAERKKREAERKAKKAAKRKGKMETLQKALELGAMSKMDHVTALRRLQAVTGEDPTNPGRDYTLPETMQWFSTTLEVLWPHLRTLLSEKLKDICGPALEGVGCAVGINSMDLGNHAPAFGPISAKYIDGAEAKESIEIGLGVTYQASVDIRFQVGDEEAIVQKLKFVGTMYFWLKPFLNRVPFIGGLQASFVNPPTVKFMFLTAQSLAFRKAQQIVQRAVEKALAEQCVVPNYITIPFGEGAEGCQAFNAPVPQGVLRLTVVGGKDLEAADEGFNPTSDPYVTVKVGAQKWRTPTIQENLDPVWTEGNVHNFMVYSPEQWVVLDAYDEDEGKTDDHLGGVVGLPINRLVLRCLDTKTNPSGTVDLPLTRNNQPVQGETGEVSTLTVRAEWLTVDQSSASSSSSLVAVYLKDLESLPPGFKGPFRIRVTINSDEHATTKLSRMSFPLAKGMTPEALFKMISQLAKEGKTASDIADTLSSPLGLVQAAVAIINNCGQTMMSIGDAEDDEMTRAWIETATQMLKARDSNDHPYFLDTVYIHTQSMDSSLKLELLDSCEDVMGTTTVKIVDDKLGDEPDVVGPFEIPLPSVRGSVLLNGHVVVSCLKDKGVPNSWNPRSKRHKAMGDQRKQRPNEDLIKQNAGGKLTDEKEEALMECLKAGALTWGDYDILIGKLRGESDRTSIAETLEWVNMILKRVWPMFRRYLEKKIMVEVGGQLKVAAESLPGQSWTGLAVELKKVDLGAKEPSFTTIEAWKKEKNSVEGLVISFNNINYNSNIDVEVEVTLAGQTTPVRIKDFKLTATLCVEVHDLTSEPPFVGSLEAYFPNPPHIDLTIDVGNSTQEIPGMRSLSVGALNSVLAREVVLPNTIYWGSGKGVAKQKRTPAGVLKLAVLRAKHLLAGDVAIRFVKDANSDSYAHIRLGSQIFSTKQITSLDPEWLETFYVIVHDKRQWVDIEVFDADIKSDDSLGSVLQLETVLGGGTDIISRGISVEGLCRKIWSADDRNKEYVNLPLCIKEKDDGLSVDGDPYLGARVVYKGGGKYKGSVEFEDGTVLDEGDEGVVTEIDDTTKPFTTFTCEFPKATVGVHAGDLTVPRPLIVHKMTHITGADGNPSCLHVHPEWLTTTNPGKHTSHLVSITPKHILNTPSLAERDLGGPFKLRFTGVVSSLPDTEWGKVESAPAGPEEPCSTPLTTFVQTMVKMQDKQTPIPDIAKVLELTEDLVKEGLEMFGVPVGGKTPEGEKHVVTVKPAKKNRGKTVEGFAVFKGESVDAARRRLRKAVNAPMGTRLALKNPSGKKMELDYESAASVDTLTYAIEDSPAAASWLSRAHAHVNKLSTATRPTFTHPTHLVSPAPSPPSIRIELLTSSGEVLGTTTVQHPYPASPYMINVKQEASGGWGFGMGAKEGYEYDFELWCDIRTEELKMMS